MKLKTKLVPIMGICATVATATPLALTSCNSATMVDLTSGIYVPSQGQCKLEGNKGTLETIEKTYFQAVQNNPQIFVEDFYWSLAREWKDYADSKGWTIENLQCLISNCSVEYKNIKDESGTVESRPCITYDQQMTLKYSYVSVASSDYGIHYTVEHTFKNKFVSLPVKASTRGVYSGMPYSFDFDEDRLYDMDLSSIAWKIDRDWTCTVTSKTVDVGQGSQEEVTTQHESGVFTDWFTYQAKTLLDLSEYYTTSYYMLNIRLVDEE